MPIDPIQIQLERLQRHFERSVREYDEISLLDLSHTLRIWTELKGKVNATTVTPFESAVPAKRIRNAIKKNEYVILELPGGVNTYASQGQIAFSQDFERQENASLGARIKIIEDGQAINISSYSYLSRNLSQEEMSVLAKGDRITRLNFSQWLGAEAVRLAYRDTDGVLKQASISREILIKRVANIMDASHPSVTIDTTDNRFDPHIHYLMTHTVGGLPLPYLLLLKIAQDILEHMPRILKNRS